MPSPTFPASARTHLHAWLVVIGVALGAPPVTCSQAPVPGPAHPGGPAPASQPPPGPLQNAALDVELRVSLGAPPAAPAALDAGSAYVPLRTGRLMALDLSSGRVRWSAAIAVTAAPAAGDGVVFVPQADGLTAIASNGTTRWRLSHAAGFSTPLLWKAGWLIAAANDGDVLGVRADDGQVVWRTHVTSPVRGRPALTAEHVYLSLEDGRVVAQDLATGAARWERRLGGMPGPVLALDDRVFVGAADRFFYCLAAKDGKRKWRSRMSGGILGEPVIDAHQVYFVALDNVLRALHRWNGSQRWKQGLPVRPSGPPLLVGSILYVAGVAAELHAYRCDTGANAGTFVAPAELASPPQLVRESLDLLSAVVLLTRTGDLQVLRRRIEPALVPLDYPLGVPVPLVPPPAATGSAS